MVELYQTIVRPVLFSDVNLDPEWLTQQTLRSLGWLQAEAPLPLRSWLLAQLYQSYGFEDARLSQTLWGHAFPHPVGLAAGFDKDGVAADVWRSFGFGFAELGTVTGHAQPGNLRPRLFRLPVDGAALNRMGFNNQGAVALADRLRQRQATDFTIGINLGKSKITPLETAAQDYLSSFQCLKTLGNYFVVNVSSPNTPGLRSLQAVTQLEPILAALQAENQDRQPILLKIAPDLAWEDLAAILALAQQYQLAGVIATNTTISREGLKTTILKATGQPVSQEAGGISGRPLRDRSTEVIRFIWQQTGGELPIVGVGGIFSAADAWEKIIAGASLVQVYTGWIYEGPGMVRRILQGLLERLDEHGLERLEDAIALEHRRPVK